MKKIYVAGASAELAMIQGFMAKLRASDKFSVTYDWTVDVAKHGSTGEGLTREERRGHAAKDIEGVREADLFWMLVPSGRGVGAWVELGAAIIRSHDCDVKPGIVVSGDLSCIFTELADKRFATHDEALAWLLEMV